MKIQIRKVNGLPMGRPVNEHPQFVLHGQQNEINPEWEAFEQSVTEHEAPGFEEGEAEGELQWQWKHPFDKDWQNEPIHEPYFDMNKEHEISVHQGNETRQIWIVSTPEKAEVKEDDYKTITEDEVKNWCSGSFGNNYILERLTDLLKGEYSLEEARDDVLGFRTH